MWCLWQLLRCITKCNDTHAAAAAAVVVLFCRIRVFFGRLKDKVSSLFRCRRKNRYSSNALVSALKRLDDPGDWDRLMVIGHELGKQYRSRIEDWVDAWVVGKSVGTTEAASEINDKDKVVPAAQPAAAVVVEEEVLLTMVVEPAVATKDY